MSGMTRSSSPKIALQLRAGQRRAQAVVRPAAAEAEVAVGAAGDVEAPTGRSNALVVAVARVVEEDHLLPGRERLAVQLDLARGGAAEGQHRRRPAHELLDGVGQPRVEVLDQHLRAGRG